MNLLILTLFLEIFSFAFVEFNGLLQFLTFKSIFYESMLPVYVLNKSSS